MRTVRVAAVSASVIGLMVFVAGCSSSGVSYAVLDRDAQPSDQLPEQVIAGSTDIDPSTARLVGDHDGVDLWLTRAETADTVCLVVFPNEADWVVGCGAEGGGLGVGGPSGDYLVVSDGSPSPDGATKLSENVYVEGP
jgi:hypothetical protein